MAQASHTIPEKGFWWSREDAERALQMFNVENASYNDIALKFGRTRGAVAGLFSRYRNSGMVLPKRGQGMIANIKNKRKPTLKVSPQVMLNVVQTAPTPPRRIRLRLIESDTEVTFADLQYHHCKWPIGDPRRPDFRFCGCDRIENKPYCAKHTVMAGGYVPERVRR